MKPLTGGLHPTGKKRAKSPFTAGSTTVVDMFLLSFPQAYIKIEVTKINTINICIYS
jgi:hypothetical protein